MHRPSLLPLVALASTLVACQGTGPDPLPRHNGVEVIINEGHDHSRYCGHYRVGTRWYYERLHKHGVNCGHEASEDGHTWILASR